MKTLFLFPGVGSQCIGMGKELYDESRIMQEYFEEAGNCIDKNFVKLCFAASDATLKEVENSYLALFLLSSSIAAYLKEQGVHPDMVAGFDLGEFAAAQCAGSLSIPDGLYLLSKYAGIYDQVRVDHPAKALLINGLDEAEIKDFCEEFSEPGEKLYISVYSGKEAFIVAGNPNAIKRFEDRVRELSYSEVKSMPEGGLHTPLMDDVVKNLKSYLVKVDFKDPKIAMLASVVGTEVIEGDSLAAAIMQQIHAPILWNKFLEQCEQYDMIIEMGGGSWLLRQVQKMYPKKICLPIATQKHMDEIKKLYEGNNDDASE